MDLKKKNHKIIEALLESEEDIKAGRIYSLDEAKQIIQGLNAHKFCGTISLKMDALKLQREIRDEWQ